MKWDKGGNENIADFQRRLKTVSPRIISFFFSLYFSIYPLLSLGQSSEHKSPILLAWPCSKPFSAQQNKTKRNSGLYQAGLIKCLFTIWCHGAWAHIVKDLSSRNISCKIKAACTYLGKCAQASYQPYIPLSPRKSKECGPPLPLPGLRHQLCLELLGADESHTKGCASSGSRPTLSVRARTQPHKFLPKFSVFSMSQRSHPPFWHFPSEKFDSHSPYWQPRDSFQWLNHTSWMAKRSSLPWMCTFASPTPSSTPDTFADVVFCD